MVTAHSRFQTSGVCPISVEYENGGKLIKNTMSNQLIDFLKRKTIMIAFYFTLSESQFSLNVFQIIQVG